MDHQSHSSFELAKVSSQVHQENPNRKCALWAEPLPLPSLVTFLGWVVNTEILKSVSAVGRNPAAKPQIECVGLGWQTTTHRRNPIFVHKV